VPLSLENPSERLPSAFFRSEPGWGAEHLTRYTQEPIQRRFVLVKSSELTAVTPISMSRAASKAMTTNGLLLVICPEDSKSIAKP